MIVAGLVSALILGASTNAIGQEPSPTTSLSDLLSATPSGSVSPIAQVKRVDLGAKSATITLQGGEQVLLDFGELVGVGGGPNYLGWAMVVFGLSVAVRLLSTLVRLSRPFAAARRRRRYDDE